MNMNAFNVLSLPSSFLRRSVGNRCHELPQGTRIPGDPLSALLNGVQSHPLFRKGFTESEGPFKAKSASATANVPKGGRGHSQGVELVRGALKLVKELMTVGTWLVLVFLTPRQPSPTRHRRDRGPPTPLPGPTCAIRGADARS